MMLMAWNAEKSKVRRIHREETARLSMLLNCALYVPLLGEPTLPLLVARPF